MRTASRHGWVRMFLLEWLRNAVQPPGPRTHSFPVGEPSNQVDPHLLPLTNLRCTDLRRTGTTTTNNNQQKPLYIVSCIGVVLWLLKSACVAGVHKPAKPVCGRHVAGTAVVKTCLELSQTAEDGVGVLRTDQEEIGRRDLQKRSRGAHVKGLGGRGGVAGVVANPRVLHRQGL